MKSLFFLLSLISFIPCVAQLDKEFVITLKGDTLYGSVTRKNSIEVEFTSNSIQKKIYTTDDIIRFYDHEAGLYISLQVSLSISQNNKTEVIQTEAQNIFFEKVIEVDGISIFYFKNAKYGEHYFIQKENSSAEELILNKKVSEINGRLVTYNEELYKKTLSIYLSECNSIQDLIKTSKLSKKSFYRLLSQYSDCISKSPSYKSTLDRGEWSFGVLAGGVFNTFNYTPPPYKNDILGASDFKDNSGFVAGFSAHYLISKKSRKFSVLNELVFKNIRTSQNLNLLTMSPPFVGDYLYTYQFDYLRLNTMVRYNFTQPAIIHPFLSIGISNGFAIKRVARTTNLTISQRERDPLIRPYEQGLIIGVGANYKRFDLFTRYELSNGFFANNAIGKLGVRSLSFGIGYFFK
jgi:Outer membrane protein beta-barrel domain